MQKMEIDWTIVGPFTDLKEQESKWFLPLKKEEINKSKSYFIYFLFSICVFIIIIKLSSLSNNEYLNPYNKYTNYKIKYLLPTILDKNNKPIVENLKLFDLYIDPRYISKDKLPFLNNTLKEHFSSYYLGLDIKKKRQKILENITIEQKKEIEEILYNFKDLNIFKTYSSQGRKYLYFPEFVLLENRKTRTTTEDGKHLQPYVGFYNENEAINGFEKWYSTFNETKYLDILTPFQKEEKSKEEQIVQLSVDISLTKSITQHLIAKNTQYESEKIISGIVDTKTGKILSIATSNIWEEGVEADNTKNDFVNFLYEPGSIIKPLSYLSALENNIITPTDEFDIGNGKLKVDKYTIKDDHADKKILTAEEVIVHSSNVGITKIVENLNGQDFLNTFTKIGMFNKPFLELPYISKNKFSKMKKIYMSKDILIHKANVSYGYGFMATPLSLMTMYNSIINNCNYVPLSILENKKVSFSPTFDRKYCQMVKDSLIRVVEEGTGIYTQVPGLTVGGKTGTAHIVGAKGYSNKFNASFIGFVSDGKNTYTTFTLVHRPSWRYHYASQSAAKINKIMIQELINHNYLKPKL